MSETESSVRPARETQSQRNPVSRMRRTLDGSAVANQEDYATFMKRHGRSTPEAKDEIEILDRLEL